MDDTSAPMDITDQNGHTSDHHHHQPPLLPETTPARSSPIPPPLSSPVLSQSPAVAAPPADRNLIAYNLQNPQGLGETFGRVTIKAMAFGIPVLGTDAGGTKEIVEHNVTGLLHPIGHPGTTELSRNLKYLLKNPSERHQIGLEGREKVKKMYLKKHMYKMFWQVLYDTMKVK